MRFINKHNLILPLLLALGLLLGGCGGTDSYLLPYQVDRTVRTATGEDVADAFASSYCVVNTDVTDGTVETPGNVCAGLFDLNARETLFSFRVHDRRNPASLTKVMTALVALKYGTPDQMLTATEAVNIDEDNVTRLEVWPGDQMTLDQALHLMLISSANDVAVMIAENIGGSVEGFAELMNKEALLIGATNSHFENPHGLTSDNHYVTAYDMYLIFQAAMQYEEFVHIINMTSYTTTFRTADGTMNTVDVESTNAYLRGMIDAPSNVTVIGGKTGTTRAAGHCLILMSRDSAGAPYIAVVLGAENGDVLYEVMTNLLEKTV